MAKEECMVKMRGSEKLMAAWKNRALTEESVREIATELEKSPATVESAAVVGGTHATGVQVSLSYEGDDVPWCGNDLLFWLRWHRLHGVGRLKPPKILINGTPWPDFVRLELSFGDVGPSVQEPAPLEDLAIRDLPIGSR